MTDFVLWVHIITSIGAMVLAIGIPLQLVVEQQNRESDPVALAGRMAPAVRIYVFTLLIAGVLGFGLVSMTEEDVSWGDPWVWLSIVAWIAANGVIHGVFVPAMRSLAQGDTAAEARAKTFGAVGAALIALVLILMLVKPG